MWSKTAALRHTYPLKYDNQAVRSWSEGLGDYVANTHEIKDDIMAGYHGGGNTGCDLSYPQFPSHCSSHGERSASCVLGGSNGDLSRSGLHTEQLHEDGQGHQRLDKVVINIDSVEHNGDTTNDDQKLHGFAIRRHECEGITGRMQFGGSRTIYTGIPNEDELDDLMNGDQDPECDVVQDAWEELFEEDNLQSMDNFSLRCASRKKTGTNGSKPSYLGGGT